jgi:hypothetical protein|tara:strand:+ start:582 stop:737 length:156 start_codon:yes stop_codon:yes gene_type:complete
MKVGDLVKTRKGNLCMVTEINKKDFCVDVLFVKTGVLRTGLPMGALLKVVK